MMNEQEFIDMLVSHGWEHEAATKEAHEQYHGDLGDCDGDLREARKE